MGEFKQIFRIKRGIILGTAGLLFGIILLPKVVPFWFNQLQGLFVYAANFGWSYLIYEGLSKDLVAGAICANTHIDDAIKELKKERELTEVEMNAFQNFANEIQSLATQSGHVSDEEPNQSLLLRDRSNADDLKAVRNCYRETVMSVPEYEDVYGESFAEHFAAEFGDEIAVPVLQGGPLTPALQSLLITQASQSVTEREQFLEKLEMEYQSVHDAKKQLQEVEHLLTKINKHRIYQYSFDELIEHSYEINKAKEKCHKIMNNRQDDIFDTKFLSYNDSDDELFQEYLYSTLPTQHPVLSSTLSQLQRVKSHGKTVRKSISMRY